MEDITVYATCGDLPGEIDLQWDAIPDAKSYIVQLRKNNGINSPWKFNDIITDSHYTVTGLKSKMSFCFRIAAITQKGQRTWSNVVIKKTS